MANRRRSSRFRNPLSPIQWDLWKVVGLGAVVLAVLALAYGGYKKSSYEPVERIAIPNPPVVTTFAAPRAAEGATALPGLAVLLRTGQPVSLAVAGDSTGNAADEWVYLMAEKFADKDNRKVTVHNWSIDTNTYDSETVIGPDDGAPVTIWNGSASGKNAGYSVANWAAMVPERINFAIVNHGHNQDTPEQTITDVGNVIARAGESGAAATAVVLQNPRLDDNAARQADIVSALRAEFTGTRFAVIDVYTAFENSGDVTPLLNPEDRFHPSPEGEQLWARTVESAVGLT